MEKERCLERSRREIKERRMRKMVEKMGKVAV